MPSAAEKAMAMLREQGYEAYLVGGCVRDFLMGREPKDFDLTTNAQPEETERVFSGQRIIETGLQHGTVTVLLEGLPLEITTYRLDGDYSDHRHPDGVAFTTSLREDLARRDFTVNAMAYNPWEGLQDPFGGQSDLAARRIRCVGDPDCRFGEDALRILRALRFSSQLDFDLDPATEASIHKNRESLGCVSWERIREELTKLLCGVRAGSLLCGNWDVLGVPVPELLQTVGFDQKNPHHCLDVLAHTAAVVDHCPREPVLRWAALLHDLGKPETFSLDEDGVGHFWGHAERSCALAETILRRLRFDRASMERILLLVKHHDAPPPADAAAMGRLLRRLGPEASRQLLQLGRADNLGQSPAWRNRQEAYDRAETLLQEALKAERCFSLRDLAIHGGDLLALGLQGPEIGKTLNRLLDAVAEGSLENDREILLREAKKAADAK